MARGATDVILVIVAILLPPLAAVIKRGCGVDLVINIILTLFGHIPGVIHALYLVLRDRERRNDGGYPASGYKNNSRAEQALQQPPPQQQQHQQYNGQAMYGQGPGYENKTMIAQDQQPMYNNNNNNVHATPPFYSDYTERDIVGHSPQVPEAVREKHEYNSLDQK